MNKKYNIFKVVYFIILALIIFGYRDLSSLASDLNYVECGSATGIPRPIPQLTTVAYTLVVTATPLILIVFSIILLFKAIATGSADEIEKAKKNLFKKFIIAAVIFFIASIIQFVLLKVTTNKEDSKSVTECIKCFMYYSKTNCPTSSADMNYTTKRTKKPNTSNYTNSNIIRSSNRTSSSSNNNTSNSTSGSNVLLIGDSRTAGICGYGDGAMHSGEKCRDYTAIAKGGMGATWFRDDAISAANIVLNGNSGNYKILILMGANDVGDTAGTEKAGLDIYQSKLSELAKGDWKKHTIIFVKTTCADQAAANSYNMHVSQSQINTFNAKMKEYINSKNISNLKYCEIEDVPKKYLVDGVHYSKEGYDFYYNQIKNKCV